MFIFWLAVNRFWDEQVQVQPASGPQGDPQRRGPTHRARREAGLRAGSVRKTTTEAD